MARRSKRKFRHWRLLLVVGVLAVAVGLPVAYFGGRQLLIRRINSWRQEGFAAAQAGDQARAADMLLRYLKRRPGDVEALRRYAEVRESVELPDGRHLTEAVGALQLLLAEEPGSLDDRRHLLELLVRLDRRPEALDTAEAILRRAPSDVRTLELKTEVLLKSGRERQALDAAQQWSKAAPLELKAQMARLALRSRMGNPHSAIVADATALREANPGDVRFEILQGFAHAQAGDDAEAGRWLKSAARAVADESLAKTLVEQFDALGMCDDSLAVLEGLAARGGSAEVRHALGQRLWELGRWKEAVAALADVTPADTKSDATLLALKGIALAEQGLTADAEACRAALAARDQQAEARAWALLLLRNLESTAGRQAPSAGGAAATPVDDRRIVAECRAALALDPQNGYLDYHLGEARARLGELDLAIGSWRRASAEIPAWNQPAVRLVEALLQKGQAEQAMRVATGAARRNPRSAASVITLARAWAAGVEAGRVGQAEELLRLVEEVQKQVPGEEKTLIIPVQVLAQSGKTGPATDAARQVLARTPPPSEGTLLALSVTSRRFGLGLERQCFDASEKAHGPTPSLVYARAVDRYIAGEAAAGLKLIDEASARGGAGAATGAGAVRWRLMRTQYIDLTGDPAARRAWGELAAAFPDDLAVQQAAVSARAVRGDWEFLEPTIQRLRRLGGDGALAWQLAQARLMVESPRNDEDYARGSVLLSQIIREHPQLPEPRVLMARTLVRMKRLDAAVEQLSAALRLDPSSVPVALQLSGLLQSRGDFERVRQELDRVVPHLRTAGERRQAALLLAQQGNRERAAQLLEEQQAQADGTPQEALLLAAIYRRDRQFDKAEAVVRKLLERPTLGAVTFAASLYASQGRREEAEKALALLDGLELDPGVKQLAVGSYLSQSGDAEGAIQKFAEAAKLAPSNGAAWRILAAALMARGRTADAMAAVEAGVGAAPSDESLAEIRKHAALLSAANEDGGLRPLVLAVLRDPASADASVELLRTVMDGRREGDAERLVARLEQFVERNPASLPARAQLIEAHRAAGNLRAALAVAKQATSAFPTNPAPARIAFQVAAADARWDDAQAAARAWKQRAPEEARDADVAAARAQVGLRQYDAALAVLQPHYAAAAGNLDREPELVTTYCLALAKAGRVEEAEKVLWPLAEKSSAWRVRWAETAIALDDGARAVRWADRLAAAVPASAPVEDRLLVADTYNQLGARLNDGALTEKSSRLFRALAASPDVTAVALVAAASQAEGAGDAAAAEGLYRRAIAMNGRLGVAYNNLAVLVARRGGNPQEALAAASEAVRLRPREATFHDTLALVHSRSGDAKAAAEAMHRAVRLEPENLNWRVQLVQYLADAGNTVEAVNALRAIDARGTDLNRLSPDTRKELENLRRQFRRTVMAE